MQSLKNLEMLGYSATDKVTGFSGVITSISFDLYGCVQAVISPKVNLDGEVKEGRWFDVTRLDIQSCDRVMQCPNFDSGYIAEGKKGCSFKSIP